MRKTIAVAAVFAALVPGAAIAGTDTEFSKVDVAYEALSEGRTAEAIAQLDNSRTDQSDDPATLINLGTAYVRQGKLEEAKAMYRAAMYTDIRYELELADGSWVDSRKAARMALKSLETRSNIAMR